MLYYLIAILCWAIILLAFGILPYSPLDIFLQSILFLTVCWLLNALISRVVRAKTNLESSMITGLILSCLAGPLVLPDQWSILVLMSAAAIGSKYLLLVNKSHIFNPAGFGAVASAVIWGDTASWWVGSTAILPVVFLGGILVTRRIRRFALVITFLGSYLFLSVINLLIHGQIGSTASFLNSLIFSPIIFFVFVMLVEPLTAPQTHTKRLSFSALVGAVFFLLQTFASQIVYALELSLLAGNIFTKLIERDFRQAFVLKKEEKLSDSVSAFWFEPTRRFDYKPGQFLEYTLPHSHSDSRGTRRFFSIASSPTEGMILLASKFSEPGSSFKTKLKSLDLGDEITASKVAGDFVLPFDINEKLVFIAGGIGITPFRSMVKFLLDNKEGRDIVLLYAAKTEQDLVFRNLFETAKNTFGMRNVYILSENTPIGWSGRQGIIDESLIREEISDFPDRVFYISGPEPMVQNIEKMLAGMALPKKQIKRDYFPGYDKL